MKELKELLKFAEMYLEENLSKVRAALGDKRRRKQDIVSFAKGIRTRSQRSIDANKAYWARMTPEERSAEIKRRFGVAKTNKRKAAKA